MAKVITVVFLAGLAAAAWFGYQKYLAPPSPIFLAYQQYADAMAREQYDRAESLATGPARDATASLRQAAGGSQVKVYGQTLSMRAPSVREIAGDVHSIKWEKRMEKKSPDGGHGELSVTETVCRIPPGVSSVLCKWPVEFRHDVEVQLEDGIWKVYSFREERITP